MLTIKIALLALAMATPRSTADEGQGTAEPGAHIAQLNMGSHVLGASFDTSEMLGKIVVVEIGGG